MTSTEAVQLILASSSPRRKELLNNLGLSFEILPSHLEEHIDPLLDPAKIVRTLAVQKAQAVAESLLQQKANPTPALILGCDTLVVLEGLILGKPASPEEANQMLCQLSGRCHQVYTGVALVRLPSLESLIEHEISRVHMRVLKPAEIAAYVATGEPLDKAGSYALQGLGAALVEKIEGCFTNIIGLPIPLVVRLLRQQGLPVLGTL